jgi:hypothetical protein
LALSSAAQAAETLSLKTSNSVVGAQQIKGLWSINQRVNLAVGKAEKIERDSRSKKREKRLRPLGRPSSRMAVRPLVATKGLDGGWVGSKVNYLINIF